MEAGVCADLATARSQARAYFPADAAALPALAGAALDAMAKEGNLVKTLNGSVGHAYRLDRHGAAAAALRALLEAINARLPDEDLGAKLANVRARVPNMSKQLT